MRTLVFLLFIQQSNISEKGRVNLNYLTRFRLFFHFLRVDQVYLLADHVAPHELSLLGPAFLGPEADPLGQEDVVLPAPHDIGAHGEARLVAPAGYHDLSGNADRRRVDDLANLAAEQELGILFFDLLRL